MNIAFKLNNSLAKHIRNAKTKTENDKKSEVYKLICGSCPKIYIGQTGRSFKVRLQEHYAQHLLVDDHQFDEEFEILHIEGKDRKLNLLELLEINKPKNSGL